MVLLTVTILFAALGAVGWSYSLMRNSGSGVGSYSQFPEVGPGTADALLAAHYDDERNPARDSPIPYIPSAMARTPYLRLVIPYVPARDEPVLHAHCPQAVVDSPADDVAGGRLACLRARYRVTLDARPLAASLELGSDPRTERPALVAMVDVRGLAPGRHELQVAVPPKPEPGPSAPARPELHRIPFWR
jgi:hypothetical protein